MEKGTSHCVMNGVLELKMSIKHISMFSSEKWLIAIRAMSHLHFLVPKGLSIR